MIEIKITYNFLGTNEYKYLKTQIIGEDGVSKVPLFFHESSVPPSKFKNNVPLECKKAGEQYGLLDSGSPPFFSHLIVDKEQVVSPLLDNIALPVLQKVKPFRLIRVKLNINTESSYGIHSGWHIDLGDSKGITTTAILYLTDNGGTLLQDGTFIEAKQNRFVQFPGNTFHTGITSTPPLGSRVLINYNYIA